MEMSRKALEDPAITRKTSEACKAYFLQPGNHMSGMTERLEGILRRYEEVTAMLSEPDVVSDRERFRELMKSHNELEPVAAEYLRYDKIKSLIEENRRMLEEESDSDMRALLKEELNSLREELPESERKLEILLLPSDPDDSKSVVVELRAGVG